MVVLQALWLLFSPAGSATELMLGLAVAAAVLLIVAAVAGISLPAIPFVARVVPARSRVVWIPRLGDPDAAGRPRPRAPSL